MVDYNTKFQLQKNLFFKTYIVQFHNIFVAKNYMSLCTTKCKYTQKMIEMFFRLYEICDNY
jgi:hypothetical protein